MENDNSKNLKKILLTDIFKLDNVEKTKIKFNMNPADPNVKAWDLLLMDDLEWLNMNRWRQKNKSNNNMGDSEYLLSFAQYYPYGPQYFIFGGYYKVSKAIPEIIDGPGYNLELQEKYSEYMKRLTIKLDRPIGRDLYLRKYDRFLASTYKAEIYELSPNTKLGAFPGYNNVRLSHKDLELILNIEEPSWRQALSAVKAIYLLTDKSNGKLYVGSASGNSEGLWQRWSSYANLQDSTGGNKELVELKNIMTNEHIVNNFQYSILEIFDTKTKMEDILYRENYWKEVLCTRKFGYNRN